MKNYRLLTSPFKQHEKTSRIASFKKLSIQIISAKSVADGKPVHLSSNLIHVRTNKSLIWSHVIDFEENQYTKVVERQNKITTNNWMSNFTLHSLTLE